MNPALRRLIPLTLILTVALPLLATERDRAVRPLPLIQITGIVSDAATTRPVVNAEVTNGTRSTTTDVSGRFTIEVPAGRPTVLVVRRSGYEPAQIAVNAPPAAGGVIVSPAPPGSAGSPGNPIAVALTPRTPVRVTEVSGTQYELDFETVQFAYVIPFSGYARSDRANFCREDGQKIEPHRNDIAKITGPPTPVTKPDCCQSGQVLGVQLDLKNGTSQRVYFNDSCFGTEVDLIGRDHSSGNFVYLNWVNVREVVFP